MQAALDRTIKSLGVTACPVSNIRCPITASVDKTMMSFMNRASPNLEHSFAVPWTSQLFEQVDWKWYTRMRDH